MYRTTEAGIAFALNDSPHEAIIRAAQSHGSETQGVLAHSRIPTLVYQ